MLELNRVYCGDCLELMKQIPDGSIDAVITDPPYGMKQNTQGGKRGNLCDAMPRIAVVGDDKPFEPSPWLQFPIVCLFGANHYADKLPASAGWLIWDKRDGGNSDGFSDAELAWTNTLNSARLYHHKWRGMIKASERDERRVHPTQKPIALMKWCMDILKIPKGATVLDPFLGSGTTAVACIQTGRNFIGFEIDPDYCAIAERRIKEAQAQCKLELV